MPLDPGRPLPAAPCGARHSGGLDLEGLARIFQHEFDHLDGVLYADRLEYKHAKAATKEIKKSGWGSDGLEWMPGVDNLDD